MLGLLFSLLLCYLYHSPAPVSSHSSLARPRWSWSCDPVARLCVKTGRNKTGPVQSEAGCRLRCAPENYLWPLPSQYNIQSKVAFFYPDNVMRDISAPSQVEAMLADTLDWHLGKLVGGVG